MGGNDHRKLLHFRRLRHPNSPLIISLFVGRSTAFRHDGMTQAVPKSVMTECLCSSNLLLFAGRQPVAQGVPEPCGLSTNDLLNVALALCPRRTTSHFRISVFAFYSGGLRLARGRKDPCRFLLPETKIRSFQTQ